jgi:putative PIN family toxin of toxin-antitoxin system
VRVLLDSNVWLAILTTKGFCRQMWRKARRVCHFCASLDILGEIEEKLRTKFGFSVQHARLMTLFVARQTELVRVACEINVCGDPDDDRILAAAIDASCSYLVSGDSDLLAVKEYRGVYMITPRELVNVIAAK